MRRGYKTGGNRRRRMGPMHQQTTDWTRRPLAGGLTFLFCWLAASTGAAAAPQVRGEAGGQFDPDRTRAVLTALIEKTIKETGVPSISIALVRDDQIVWKAAFGYANVRTKTPATPDTMYNAGSTFKAVTATAVVQLAEQGKLKLDEPVTRYLGDNPVRDRIQADKPVTFTHLLSHWSGLTSFPGRVENTMKPVWGRELPKTLEEVAAEMYSERPPETQFEYNNYGYGLAGLLVEKVSGVEFERYVCENVFKPLGAATPHPFRPSPEMVEVMALPYEPGGAGGKPRPAPQVLTEVFPAGNAYLTAEDMARFLGAHVNGGAFRGKRILSPESVKLMHEPRFGGNYAFGVRVRKGPKGNTMIRHAGRLPGMSSLMMGDVDARVGVYYMANATDVSFEIGDAAIRLLRGEPYPPPERKGIAVGPGTLDRYVGDYEMGSAVFTVTREGSSLFIQKNGKNKSELLAETPTSFFLKGDPSEVTFDTYPAGRGAVNRMVVTKPDWQLEVATKRKG